MSTIDYVMICPFCHKAHELTVNLDNYLDWLNGMSIQDAMPDLSATEREQLISEICPDCQQKIFGEEA